MSGLGEISIVMRLPMPVVVVASAVRSFSEVFPDGVIDVAIDGDPEYHPAHDDECRDVGCIANGKSLVFRKHAAS